MKLPFVSIVESLPYSKPFLFVDSLLSVNENGARGTYTFSEDAYFYRGHFIDNPITPGVILTECMAQIGVVCLGIFLMQNEKDHNVTIALSNHTIDFYKPVYPNETVTVTSEKVYFRFQKLKCNVQMHNAHGELVAKGNISGMIVPKN